MHRRGNENQREAGLWRVKSAARRWGEKNQVLRRYVDFVNDYGVLLCSDSWHHLGQAFHVHWQHYLTNLAERLIREGYAHGYEKGYNDALEHMRTNHETKESS